MCVCVCVCVVCLYVYICTWHVCAHLSINLVCSNCGVCVCFVFYMVVYMGALSLLFE